MASWVRGKCIGKGAFGVVNIAVSKRDGGVLAVKSVDRKTGLPGQLEALENEIRILRRVSSSPHVVAFLGDDVTCEATASFRNLHLEYMSGGTVADLAEHADVDERLVLVRRFAWCLVNALRHVHALGVVHCDVKGRNVLVGGGGNGGSVAKLADFGAAVEFSGGDCAAPRGSPMWMAPEVLRREYQGPESDVWSLGCTVIEMLTGKPAWADRGVDTLSQIGYSDELPVFPNSLSELGRDFLEKCLNRDRCRRWSCDQLLQHPFLLPNNSNVAESSPRCVLDWVDSRFAESENECEEEEELEVKKYNSEEKENSVKNRIGKLATESRANWETEGWVVVRGIEQVGVKWEFDNVVRVEEGMEEVGTCLEYSDLVSDGTTERNVDERVKGGMWRLVLVWRHQHGCDDTDECNRNRNRKDGIIVIAGSGCGWKCRYRYRWEKFDGIIISGIFSFSLLLCCKIFEYYLFSIYYLFRLKGSLERCSQLNYRLKMIKGVIFKRIEFTQTETFQQKSKKKK